MASELRSGRIIYDGGVRAMETMVDVSRGTSPQLELLLLLAHCRQQIQALANLSSSAQTWAIITDPVADVHIDRTETDAHLLLTVIEEVVRGRGRRGVLGDRRDIGVHRGETIDEMIGGMITGACLAGEL